MKWNIQKTDSSKSSWENDHEFHIYDTIESKEDLRAYCNIVFQLIKYPIAMHCVREGKSLKWESSENKFLYSAKIDRSVAEKSLNHIMGEFMFDSAFHRVNCISLKTNKYVTVIKILSSEEIDTSHMRCVVDEDDTDPVHSKTLYNSIINFRITNLNTFLCPNSKI
jgi:hypothetical protein